MSHDPRIGKTISHYLIKAHLGGGGMGVVYLAEDVMLKRTVALKFLPAELTRDEQFKKRFVREAQAASALDHPRIGTIYEIGETDTGEMFIAMAYYEGDTLQDRINSGTLTTNEACNFVFQIGNGLAEAHEHGIVHRDIKPANILITKDGFIKIVDFGLAKRGGSTRITKAGTMMGTPSYMSPEQVRGKEVDHRTDIWSLAVILYELLIGRLPFSGDYEMALLYSVVHDDPTPISEFDPGIPEEIEQIITKALAKDPRQRYTSVADMLADLKKTVAQEVPATDYIKTVVKDAGTTDQMSPALAATERSKSKGLSLGRRLTIPALIVVVATFSYLKWQDIPISDLMPSSPGLQADSTDVPVYEEPIPQVNLQQADISAIDVSNHTDEIAAEEQPGGDPDAADARKTAIKKTTETENSITESSAEPEKDADIKKIPLPPIPQHGSIRIASTPPGATIFVDNKPIKQKTPFKLSQLSEGRHRIRLKLAGYTDSSQEVTVTPGKNIPVNFVLQTLPEGMLHVLAFDDDGYPAQPSILLNGKRHIKAWELIRLKGGNYDISAALFLHTKTVKQDTSIVISHGDTTIVKLQFAGK